MTRPSNEQIRQMPPHDYRAWLNETFYLDDDERLFNRAKEEDYKMTDNNPKKARALLDDKDPMEQIPMHVLRGVARVLQGGAEKYGVRNWRTEPVCASTYEGAILRHFAEWQDGSDEDADSGEHPLAHVIASCLLVLDCIDHGTFIDDRDRTEVIGRE